MGEASLQIRRGTSDTFIEPPGPVEGTVAPDVWSVLEEVEQNLSSMRSFLDNISGIMGDEEIEDLKEAIKEIPSFLKEAKEASFRIGKLADEGSAFLTDTGKRMDAFLITLTS